MNAIEAIEERKRIGGLLASRRAALGLSQRGLAAACGLHKNTIDRVERGRHSIGIDIIAHIAAALGCDIGLIPRDREQEEEPCQ